MASYSNGDLIIPEFADDDFVSVALFYSGDFFSAPNSRNGSSSREKQLSLEPDISVTPICFIPATVTPVNDDSLDVKYVKDRKRKQSVNKASSKPFKPKQSRKKNPYGKNFPKGQSVPKSRLSEKDLNTDFFETSFGFSRVPSPFCSCTGFQRICYKWGAGGWQSSCCTINISKYPLPMSSTRRGSRIAGRKMSNGAYTKLLLKLASEGCDLSRPVDLKDHWARHGTNKFVTIK